MALTGDASNNKDNLRKDTMDTNYISGLSTINFEMIAKEKIFESINAAKLDSMYEIRAKYKQLKNRLNRVPTLLEFEESKMIDPFILATKEKNYHNMLLKLKETDHALSEIGGQILQFMSVELLLGHRLHELILAEEIVRREEISMEEVQSFFKASELHHDDATIRSVLHTLSTEFYRGGQAKTYAQATIIEIMEDRIALSEGMRENLQDQWFAHHYFDLLKTARVKNQAFDNSQALTLYQKYRRRDILRMLNWDEQMVDQNIGGYTYRDNKFINFITLSKGADFKGSLVSYEDKFLDQDAIEWYTKAPRNLNSPEVLVLKNFEGWTFYQFMKKSDDADGNEFYYLGTAEPQVNTMKQLSKETKDGKKSVVEMDLKLNTPVPHDLYRYFTEI